MIGLTYTIIPMTKTTKIISTLPAQKYQIIYYISQHNIYITEDPFITIYSITNHNLLFYLFLYFNLTLSFIYIYIRFHISTILFFFPIYPKSYVLLNFISFISLTLQHWFQPGLTNK
jgi:hypothetical protein